jgi:hypothetical protein
VPPNDRTPPRAGSRKRASAAAPRGAARAAGGEPSLAEARRAFEAAVKSAEAALGAILAEVAALDERRAALLRDAEDLAARIASLDPQARLPAIPAATPARAPSRRRSAARRGAGAKAAPARRGGAASSGGTERVLELLRRRPLSLAELRKELGVSATRVQQLMKPLREQGRVVSEPDPGSARPRQLWRAIDGPA